MEGMNTMGCLNVRDLKSKVEFSIGTGFDADLRKHIWEGRKCVLGKIVKYKYFAGGSKDKPRFPVFLGFRDKRDM
jgi:DNA ligase-1